jgi:hypothetical protein
MIRHSPRSDQAHFMSASPLTAARKRTSPLVRFVPTTDFASSTRLLGWLGDRLAQFCQRLPNHDASALQR